MEIKGPQCDAGAAEGRPMGGSSEHHARRYREQTVDPQAIRQRLCARWGRGAGSPAGGLRRRRSRCRSRPCAIGSRGKRAPRGPARAWLLKLIDNAPELRRFAALWVEEALATPTPMMEPISVCELEAGSPRGKATGRLENNTQENWRRIEPHHREFRRQRVGIDDGRDGVGGVVDRSQLKPTRIWSNTNSRM